MRDYIISCTTPYTTLFDFEASALHASAPHEHLPHKISPNDPHSFDGFSQAFIRPGFENLSSIVQECYIIRSNRVDALTSNLSTESSASYSPGLYCKQDDRVR